jgi:hypothetical protein
MFFIFDMKFVLWLKYRLRNIIWARIYSSCGNLVWHILVILPVNKIISAQHRLLIIINIFMEVKYVLLTFVDLMSALKVHTDLFYAT